MALILHPEFQLYEKKDMPFCSSIQVAQEFGKRHNDVLRDIRVLDCSEEFRKRNFAHTFQTVDMPNGAQRKDPIYLMTRDGFMFLVMGYRGSKAAAIKEAIIKRFNDMEEFIKKYILARDDNPIFTQAILDAHGEPKSHYFSNEYDMINRLVLGCSAKQFKEKLGLGNVPSIRPFLSDEQAKTIRRLQREDIRLLYRGVEFQKRKSSLATILAELPFTAKIQIERR